MSTEIDREALRREGWQVIETMEEKMNFSPKLESDECLGSLGWEACFNDGNFWRDSIYRRRIAQPAPVEAKASAASPWIAFSERRPSEADGKYVYVAGPDQTIPQACRLPMSHFLYPYTHWMPASAIPPLPEPVKPKSQEELDRAAAEKWYMENKNTLTGAQRIVCAFLAGLRHARAQGKGTT